MSTESQNAAYQPPALEFKSSSLTTPVLTLYNNDQETIATQLKAKIEEAPSFFKNAPVLFDLNDIRKKKLDLDLSVLTETVRNNGLIPIGIRGGTEEHKQAALTLKIAVFSDFQFNIAAAKKRPPKIEIESPHEPVGTSAEAKLITQPVRSGQRVYSAGDLIILSQVSAGAEIMAAGNIHIYGALRGRALAGVKGNTECRIFCSNLQAELISIAGIYKTCEDLDNSLRELPVQISLKDRALIINAI